MAQPQPFIVGRQSEIELFEAMLSGRTEFRILNIYGPGGIGKTVVGQKLLDHAGSKQTPMSSVDGNRPDLTSDRILYGFMEGLLQTEAGEKLEDPFRPFSQAFSGYVVVNQLLQQGGGIQSLFDVVGNVKDPASFAALLNSLGSTVTEEVKSKVSNRFALERYLRSIERTLTVNFLEGLTAGMEAVGHPIALLIDTYEEMEGLDDWVCRMFVPNLPEGAYLVITGRNQLHKINFDWNEHKSAILAMPLPELGEAEAKAYLRHFGLTDPVALDQVYRYTGGYPLLLVLVRHLAREAGGWEKLGTLESSADRDLIATKLLERILREERVAEVQAFLEKGVVARWFDPETISTILEINLTDARQIYEKLRRHSFIERHANGLKFHDKIRELLLDRLKLTSEAEYNRLSQRLLHYYAVKAGIEQPEDNQGKTVPPEPSDEAKYIINIHTGQGVVIGDHAQTIQMLSLAGMLVSDSINTTGFVQDFVSLLGLPKITHGAPYRSDVYPVLVDGTPLFSGMRLLTHLPLLFVRDSMFLQAPVEELREYFHKVVVSTHRIFVFIYWPEPEISRQIASSHSVVKKLQQVWAYDCVFLGREDLQKIVFSADPRGIFRRLVLSQVDLTSITPFITGGPILKEHDMFFGREKELRKITEYAVTANFAVIGGRRIGKTSILKQLESRLPTAGFRTLYHDCSYTPGEAELVQAVTADKSWFPDPTTIPPTSFASVIQNLNYARTVVILLDEADKLIELDRQTGYPLFNTMRAMSNAGRCRFVFSGEQVLRTELTNPNSPLYNFASEMLIGLLDFHAVEELIFRPMKQLEIQLEEDAGIVQRIWKFTSGHPNIVQRLCQRLIICLNQRGDRHLTLDDVEAVATDPDFLRKDFLNIYWERSTSLERLCSLIMAKDDSIRTLMTVHEKLDSHNVHTTLNEVDEALERLVDLRNILHRTSEGYEFAVTAFPEVLAKTHRLEDLIALNRETYQHHGDVEPRSKRGYQ